MAKTKTARFDLSKVVAEVLDDYADQIDLDTQQVISDVAPKSVDMLEQKSPKRTGEYAQGWTMEQRLTKRGYSYMIIYNKTDWQLTHLLENGHANRDGGRTKPVKHIAPVEKWAENEIVGEIERKIKQG